MKVIILRGLPGSGKSTRAKEYEKQGYVIVSADFFFMADGQYFFDATRLKDAHEMCFFRFDEALREGKNVVVDNTNINKRDYRKYIDYCNINKHDCIVEMIDLGHSDEELFIRNEHGVPLEVIKRMRHKLKYE